MTNEELLKEVKKEIKKLEEKQIVMPQIIREIQVLPGHSHCTCQVYHPVVQPWQPSYPYIIWSGTSGTTYTGSSSGITNGTLIS